MTLSATEQVLNWAVENAARQIDTYFSAVNDASNPDRYILASQAKDEITGLLVQKYGADSMASQLAGLVLTKASMKRNKFSTQDAVAFA